MSKFICTCDYDVYGAHSSACYDRDTERSRAELYGRIEAKREAEKAELIKLRRLVADLEAFCESVIQDEAWAGGQGQPGSRTAHWALTAVRNTIVGARND